MLTLNDGRSELWQWDTGRTLAVDADCSQVHFSNKVFGRSIDVDVVGGSAIIPDILLQTDKDLNVWAFVGTAENGYTKISKTFKVNRRNKPADYVFTPAEQMTIQTIQRQIGDLADLTTEAKDTLVAAINEAARSGGGGGGSTVELDTTLTQSGKAADAKAVGDALAGKQDKLIAGENITIAADGKTISATGGSDIETVEPQLVDIPSKLSQFENDSGFVTNSVVAAAIADKQDTLIQSGATVGQIAKIAAVDASGVPTAWSPVDMPEALPNPNALTFTGAVTGSYDGSAPLSVEIPSGGGSSGGSTAEWQLLGTYTMLVSDRSLVIDLSQFGGITHFRIIGNFPKCSEDCGQTYIYLGTAVNHTNQPNQKQNVYAFNLLAECELVDGQLYGFIGAIDGWNWQPRASVVMNAPRDSSKCTSFKIYYSNAVNDTTENTIQIWGY